jgi:hypothetical protein
MIEFYRRVLGLELLRRISDDIAFLRIADGFGGHTQYDTALTHFERLGVPTDTAIHAWIGWRST